MAKLTLVDTSRQKANTVLSHRASTTEGEAARKLLEDQGYPCKRTSKAASGPQGEFRCPFHEGPGELEAKKSTNFYVNVNTGVYFCQSASCGERGNLTTLERYFGVGQDESYLTGFVSREQQLQQYERALVSELRGPFKEHGLTDATIERFRLGYDIERGRYVIPYLESRRPRFFRYYQPNRGQANYDPRWKYTWEEGAEATLFNPSDTFGDDKGRVVLCEGEQKAMLLVQMGWAAVAVPGAGQWKPEFQSAFTHAKQILICYDNDNPRFHIYDKPEEGRRCPKCASKNLDRCVGHNPGQEAARARVESLGWRAKNVVLPLPSEDAPKTDLNDFFIRDGRTNADFAMLATGKATTKYKVSSLREIAAAPPEATPFLIEQGILPRSGRLLVAGKPKIGKSLFVDNLALSLAAGIPFLGRFKIDHPTRVMLLDRELSRYSLYKRMTDLIAGRPGYAAAEENLLIDHDHLLRLDQPGAYEMLLGLVEENGPEVVILDTAYKFMGDVESSSALMKSFDVLDRVKDNSETAPAFVLTHHMRKGNKSGKENKDEADPDSVVGSFLWTGWPNATVLLNYLQRSVENPFNAICTFVAFRDHAAPEPLALYRDRASISYSAIQDYSHEDTDSNRTPVETGRLTTEAIGNLLLDLAPTTEDDFLHIAAARYGVSISSVRPYYIDVLSSGHFEKTGTRPHVIKYKGAAEVESWEKEHGLPERPLPALPDEPELFDAAGLA